MLDEVKLLSSPNLAFFFSPAKTRSFQRRRNLSDEVKFLPSLYFFSLQVNFVIKITISTPKFQGWVFLAKLNPPTAAPRRRRPTPKVLILRSLDLKRRQKIPSRTLELTVSSRYTVNSCFFFELQQLYLTVES